MLGCRDNGRPRSHRRIIGIPRVYCAAMIGGQVRSNADTDRFRFRPAFSDSVQECSITRLASNLPTVNPLPPCRSNHPNGPIPTGNIDGTEQVNLQSTMPRHAIAAEHGQSRRLSVNICSAAHATAYRTRGDQNNNQDSHALHRRTRIPRPDTHFTDNPGRRPESTATHGTLSTGRRFLFRLCRH